MIYFIDNGNKFRYNINFSSSLNMLKKKINTIPIKWNQAFDSHIFYIEYFTWQPICFLHENTVEEYSFHFIITFLFFFFYRTYASFNKWIVKNLVWCSNSILKRKINKFLQSVLELSQMLIDFRSCWRISFFHPIMPIL